jgi:hypothetical protein
VINQAIRIFDVLKHAFPKYFFEDAYVLKAYAA